MGTLVITWVLPIGLVSSNYLNISSNDILLKI